MPWHIASKILNLKINQEHLDEVEKEKRKNLCEEIKKFHALKIKWEIGSVVAVPMLIVCEPGLNEHYDHKWYGKYVDIRGQRKRAFLAFNLDQALQRCNHVKSFIYYRIDTPNGTQFFV